MLRIVHFDAEIITVEHEEGRPPTWNDLRDIKNDIWGKDVEAFERYPNEEKTHIYDKANLRHLWRMPDDIMVPDLVGGWPDNS